MPAMQIAQLPAGSLIERKPLGSCTATIDTSKHRRQWNTDHWHKSAYKNGRPAEEFNHNDHPTHQLCHRDAEIVQYFDEVLRSPHQLGAPNAP